MNKWTCEEENGGKAKLHHYFGNAQNILDWLICNDKENDSGTDTEYRSG